MCKKKWLFYRSNTGSVTIEFSIVFVLFIFNLLFSAEISRLIYISASLDLAVSEAAKTAKNKEINSESYQSIFNSKIIEHQGMFGKFISPDNTVATVEFANSIADITSKKMTTHHSTQKLARYSVRYEYKPILFPIPSIWANSLLSREVIFVQENE
ncbi:TadE/TadG family type IV pilus assembly protein [Yersinia frederiksenii]|uniref:TadE/TadG family type IV pilus assembly protein n=1 Tax=Yersinia frederiksenii TaxID=29484 RepID=UPI0005E7ECC0|nr:TadE family protein [Yersinia frederiksenii]CNM02738.1 putative tight adherance operon protein [Yersinia frederiksenii]HEC1652536.1 pilus assembly protein [Yersinia enterocolitica]